MQVTPVRRERTPRYPTSAVLLEHPELLRVVPERWRSNPLVLRVLAGTISLAILSESSAVAQKPVNPSATHVAPLFVHGDGRGAFGCVAINPPIFLSEDEARQVIVEEAKKAGLDFAPNALTLKQVQVPVTDRFDCWEVDKKGKVKAKVIESQQVDLVMDGFDTKHRVAFEFVSTSAYDHWASTKKSCWSSVRSYDFKETAEALRAGFSKQQEIPWIGVFYEPGTYLKDRNLFGLNLPPTVAFKAEDFGVADLPPATRLSEQRNTPSNGVSHTPDSGPVKAAVSAPTSDASDWKTEFEKRRQEGKKLGEEELRKQVRDFVLWLKAQGVI